MTLLPEKPARVSRIQPRLDRVRLLEDLAELRSRARANGADQAEIIQAADISPSPELLDRVRAGADYSSIHWPAYYPRDDFEPALKAYQAGILLGVEVDPDMPDYGGGPIADPLHAKAYHLVYELTALIESACFYRGYHLALGLAAGNCRAVFCSGEKSCRAAVKGRACRHPYKARPSLEAMGLVIDSPFNWQNGCLLGLVLAA